MLLKVDYAFYLHKKGCNVLVGEQLDFKGEHICSCTYPQIIVREKETVCFLSKTDGVTYLVTSKGEVGGVRIGPLVKFIWRLNTVEIRNIKSWNGEDISVAFFLLALFLCGCIGVYSLFKTATASGIVDSCVVKEYEGSNEHTGPLYIVEGHRSWRTDQKLLITAHRDEADAKATQICPK